MPSGAKNGQSSILIKQACVEHAQRVIAVLSC